MLFVFSFAGASDDSADCDDDEELAADEEVAVGSVEPSAEATGAVDAGGGLLGNQVPIEPEAIYNPDGENSLESGKIQHLLFIILFRPSNAIWNIAFLLISPFFLGKKIDPFLPIQYILNIYFIFILEA